MSVSLPAGIAYTTPFKSEDGKIKSIQTGEELSVESLVNKGLDFSEQSLLDPIFGFDWDYDGKVSNEELSLSMGLNMSMVEGADPLRIEEIKGNFAKAIDVDKNGFISKEENMAFAVYQDSLGILDGVVSDEEAGKANLNIIDKLSETTQSIADIFNALGFGKKEEPEKPVNNVITAGSGQLDPNASWEMGKVIGTYNDGGQDLNIIGVKGHDPNAENKEDHYQMLDVDGNVIYNCYVSQNEGEQGQVRMVSHLGFETTKQLVDDGNGAFSLKGEVGTGLKEAA